VEETFAFALSLPLDEISFNVPLPLPGTPLFSRVWIPAAWEDWEVANQVKFVFPSEFDPVWLKGRIDAVLEAFRRKKRERIVPGSHLSIKDSIGSESVGDSLNTPEKSG
jgi:anaerobic magnesium-protoporphyrin IX monomethyl ester cyclase